MEEQGSVQWLESAWWPTPVALVTVGVDRPEIFVSHLLGGPTDDPPTITLRMPANLRHRSLLQEHREFVVNWPVATMLSQVEAIAAGDEDPGALWRRTGLTPIRGDAVGVPLIAECPVNLECVVDQTLRFTGADGLETEDEMVVGRIRRVAYQLRFFDNGDIQWDRIGSLFTSPSGAWRRVGPVLGYDTRKVPLLKPEEPADVLEDRAAALDALAQILSRSASATPVEPHR